MTLSRAFAGGLSVALTPAAYIRRHGARDPLFATRQVDRNIRLGVRVLHRSLRYAGFAPYLGYSFEQNRSSIPIHEYRHHGVIAGITHAF